MRIALCQIVSSADPAANLELVRDGARRAAEHEAAIALFPEATMAAFGTKLEPLAEPLDGPWASAVREIAAESGIAIATGMFSPSEDGRVVNRLLITGRGVDTHYDKLHLYDAFGFAESRTVAPGDKPTLFDLAGVTFGVTTCYDVRFPGLYTALADQGAEIILTAASWGAGPGKVAQWELLNRARALDSTTWVLAAGQADPASVGIETTTSAPTGVGCSLAVAPLGGIRAELGAEPDVLVVDVDPREIDEVRRTVPVLANRRF